VGDDLCALALVIGNCLKAFVAEHMVVLATAVEMQELDVAGYDVMGMAAVVNDYDRLQDQVAEMIKDLEEREVMTVENLGAIDNVMDALKDEESRMSWQGTSYQYEV